MMFILYIVLLIGFSIGLQLVKHKRIQSRQVKDLEETFKNSQIKSPSLKIDTSYGWTTFSITFSSKEDMDFAESRGLIGQFKKRIEKYYDKKFDPDRAVFCTYIGYVPYRKIILNDKETENRH
jgi:hypothetical protein